MSSFAPNISTKGFSDLYQKTTGIDLWNSFFSSFSLQQWRLGSVGSVPALKNTSKFIKSGSTLLIQIMMDALLEMMQSSFLVCQIYRDQISSRCGQLLILRDRDFLVSKNLFLLCSWFRWRKKVIKYHMIS
ncbi:hypothetical protein ES288_A11G094300v1 [Gossypium darwinii]|uniref:Uncharacterized protein n=1 Tax=Gossypium darwinii TaxID=34276 RepID=A0A5D2EI18_GOSDA|nr:hypothetical protein ES288_A11G094300v1 [Gossypium darwinii]